MKNAHLFILLAAAAGMSAGAFAQTVPTGDQPLGVQPATESKGVSGKEIMLREEMPAQAETTLGQKGWLKMDKHGAYWWSSTGDENGGYNWVSATQGTYKLLGHERSVVVK